ncbi:hypothetical protein [Mesorhizobium caraganae]|uniref:hypothetical protein n=1 Tax=Mesorhizobium caraganae TaxID=483206 RepID=UPI0035E436FE
MDPRRKPSDEVEAPTPRQQDWDALRGARILPDGADEESLPDTTGVEKEGDLPEEDDDNPYQDSDDACPTIPRKPPLVATRRGAVVLSTRCRLEAVCAGLS